MRVLITGGAGFIGSHLADAYLQRGDEVYVIDDLSTGSIANIKHLFAHPRFHYTIASVQNRPVTAELVDQVDVVFQQVQLAFRQNAPNITGVARVSHATRFGL